MHAAQQVEAFQPDELIIGLEKAASFARGQMRGVTFSAEYMDRMRVTIINLQQKAKGKA